MKHPPYSATPRPTDRLSVVLVALCAAVALVAFYLSTLVASYQALMQAVGFVALVALAYIVIRTRTLFLYRIEDDLHASDESDLVIVRYHGKQRITACRLATRDVRAIGIATGKNRRALREKYRGKTVHNYCPALFPERSLYLTFADSDPFAPPPDAASPRGEEIVLRIAYDETVLAVLRAELNRNHHI